MTSTPEITVSGGDYEHTLGISGIHNGMRLRYEPMHVRKIFEGMLESRSFGACEFSLANYVTLRANGGDWLTALPVFPYRSFRHGLAVTRRESDLHSLAQLAGKRVGVEDYSMTAAVWFRGLLKDEHGIEADAVSWVTPTKQRFAFPASARVEKTDADLEDLLLAGKLDALLGMSLRDNALPAKERRLRPVLSDPQAAEEEYYRRTGIYPIMHCVVIRNDVLDANPGLPEAISSAYASAKDAAYRRMLGTTLAPWGKQHWNRGFEIFGGDPLPYGLTSTNRMVVERLAQYLQQQGYAPEPMSAEALFPLG